MSKLNEKFMITLDKSVADQLVCAGFKLVSHQGAAYTFLNQAPKNFNFEQIDKAKLLYTNMLSI